MATYDKVPQAEATEAPLPSPSSQSTVGFTKAALVFDHKLQSIRRKHDSGVSVTSNPSTPGLELKGKQSIVVEEKEIAEKPTEIEIILGRSIRILLALKSIVTGILSVSIAVFQGRAYIIWNNTKNVDGAWPPVPFLAPTLILFSVAIAAFVFDVCLAVAYIFPGKRVANKAIKIAQSAYWVISTAKTAGYGVTAVVCRSGFDFGNASGTNSDLWSWTCSDKSDQFSSVNQSESNCECQSMAWYFSIINVAIEVLGFAINKLIAWRTSIQEKKSAAKSSDSVDAASDETLEKMRQTVDAEIGQYSPSGDAK